jgi:hypothetical protein
MSLDIVIVGTEAVELDMAALPQSALRASIRAMNRGIVTGRTVMLREISRDTGLQQKDIREALHVREATAARPEARLATSLKRIPLVQFNARGPEPSRGRGKGVTYRMRGGRGRHPHAFIATMKSGHRGAFIREGKRRLRILELYGPSLGRVFAKYRAQGLSAAVESFRKNFGHELDFERSGAGRSR